MYRFNRIIFATVLAIGLCSGMATAQTTTKTVTGEIATVNVKEQTLSLRDERTGKLQRYRVEPDTEFTMGDKNVDLSQVRPGFDATLVIRQTSEGLPVIVSAGMTKVLANVAATAPKMTTQTVKGEIATVNVKEQTLSLRDEKTGKLQRYRVEPGTEFSMRGKTAALRDVRPGYDATLVVRQTAEGLPVVVSMGMPKAPVADPAPTVIAKNVPAKPQPPLPVATPKPAASKPAPLPARLPKTGGPLPLIGLLGAGALALASGLRAFRTRGSRTRG